MEAFEHERLLHPSLEDARDRRWARAAIRPFYRRRPVLTRRRSDWARLPDGTLGRSSAGAAAATGAAATGVVAASIAGEYPIASVGRLLQEGRLEMHRGAPEYLVDIDCHDGHRVPRKVSSCAKILVAGSNSRRSFKLYQPVIECRSLV